MRFVPAAEGIEYDTAHRLPGRGAYVHKGLSCWGKMLERGQWEHAFRGAVRVTPEGLQLLQQLTRGEVAELSV